MKMNAYSSKKMKEQARMLGDIIEGPLETAKCPCCEDIVRVAKLDVEHLVECRDMLLFAAKEREKRGL